MKELLQDSEEVEADQNPESDYDFDEFPASGKIKPSDARVGYWD
jgi:hypothetical protein